MAKINATGFLGMNNVQPPTRLKMPSKDDYRIEASEVVNADIDNSSMIHTRLGGRQVASGAASNLWSDPSLSYALFTSNGVLKSLNPQTGATAVLKNGLGPRVVYQRVNNIIVYTDGQIISALVNGVDTPFPVTPKEFKRPIPPGQCLALYNRRLYIGAESTLFYTDAGLNIGRMDDRLCKIPLQGYITMVITTGVGGIYVSHGGVVAFLRGSGPNKFNYEVVDSSPAILGTGVVVGRDTSETPVVMWASSEGIMMGSPAGVVTNLTKSRLKYASAQQGGGFFRSGDINQYVVSLQ
jgi:hypothetical protein